jgi:hypothetical protein
MSDALASARAMLLLMGMHKRRYAIVLRHEQIEIKRLTHIDEVRPSWSKPPSQLVGVYDFGADAQDVAEDIIATAARDYATRQTKLSPNA